MAGFEQTTPIRAGRTLSGRYRLVTPIARGGMAEVWEAHDEILSRPVAAKLLQQHLAGDAVFVERFRREAVTVARLAHPGIVATFDTGVDEGTAYIVMEMVRGRNLRQMLSDNGPLEPWQAVAVARQVADALAYAHQAGLVHRDIKPANVLLLEDEWGGLRVKVTDFGIAKASAGLDSDLTRTGTVLGTPKYLSPEQIRGEEPDARADLYSLGVVLYEMLSGDPPFVGDTDMATALAHLNNPVPRLSARNRRIPAEVDRLVGDLLAKDPGRRIANAAVLRQRLDALGPLSSPSGSGRPAKWALRGRPAAPPSSNGRGAQPTTVLGNARNSAPPTVASPARPRPGGATVSSPTPRPPRDPTDEFAPSGRVKKYGRHERQAAVVVLSLLVVGAVVAGILFITGQHRLPGAGRPAASGVTSAQIASVSVYMLNGHSPDNPQDTPKTIDGDPNTAWFTDRYSTPAFGNLYPGMGLALTLNAAAKVSKLEVTTPTVGWAAQVYVSAGPVASGQPVTAWGQPTDTQTNINGTATFDLGGHTARYVLLFLTNLGPSRIAQVNELKVR